MTFNLTYAEKGTFVDSVKFVQYLDENTALEEIKKGNLDLYYYRISPDRIEDSRSQNELSIYDSTGGSYSLLVNPAHSEKFNPFEFKEIRFALNYLIDRKLIVNELMGGYGTLMYSNYGVFDADYISIIKDIESFHFGYNPSLAKEMIFESLKKNGALKQGEFWTYDGQPIEVMVFIRSDDPVRKSIGEILSSDLENLGFKVKKDFGDLNKAFVVVYGSDPSDLKWNIYTEGWAGRSAFVRYDSIGLAQMYAPWFSNMPGFNNPDYWNYKNDKLDSLTQEIYTGNFSSALERMELIRESTVEGVNESVRIFLASKIDQYVTSNKVSGIINDFGAGVPSRFTPINARIDSNNMIIGVKQIYQGAWNPVMGFSDTYSRYIWDEISDPGLFRHPYNGKIIPVRTTWEIETAGPNGILDVPKDAVTWDTQTKAWKEVKENTTAVSKVRIDFNFSNWHHGTMMDFNDIMYSLGFSLEWGSEQTENDKTLDSEFTPRALQFVKTFVAIKKIDEHTAEVYVNYWNFDEGEIADWTSIWSVTPWEISAAMEQAVLDGKAAFSRSGAVEKNVNWLSLIIPNDAKLIEEYLREFRESKFIPDYLTYEQQNLDYASNRYQASIDWIESKNHVVISNGPFYLESYSPESRTIMIKSFVDDTYPFQEGYWSEFENVKFPKIKKVSVPDTITRGNSMDISIESLDATEIQYFITSNEGKIIDTDIMKPTEPQTVIHLNGSMTENLPLGSNEVEIFVNSEDVLRPDVFGTSFLVTGEEVNLVNSYDVKPKKDEFEQNSLIIILPAALSVISGFLIWKYKMRKD